MLVEEYIEQFNKYLSFDGICWWIIDYKNDPSHYYCNDYMADIFSLDKSLKKHSVSETCPIAGDYNKNIPLSDNQVDQAKIVFEDYQKLVTLKIDEYHNIFPYYNEQLDKLFYFSSRAKVLEKDENGDILFLFGMIEDITLYEEQRLELERVSQTDILTNLYNRLKIDSVLEYEIQRTHRSGAYLSVIMLDIDHFKHINDEYGHLVGDEVLQAAAEVLQENVRKTDSVARWGGEEFLVVCPDTPLAGAKALAEKLRKALFAMDILEKKPITASFGVTVLNEKENKLSLIAKADRTLYCAKELGRDRVETFSEL